jgi:hypothetical protein
MEKLVHKLDGNSKPDNIPVRKAKKIWTKLKSPDLSLWMENFSCAAEASNFSSNENKTNSCK